MDADTKWGMAFALFGIALALIAIGIPIVNPSYELFIGYFCIVAGVVIVFATIYWLFFKR